MIKNLMFDLGGVIMDIRRENAVKALQEIGLDNADDMLGVYGQKGVFLQLEKGECTPAEFHDAIRPEFSRAVTDAQIDDAFMKFLIGIPVDRLRQLEQLRGKYNIYLLSNTNPIMWNAKIADEFRKDGHDLDYYFDGTVASFDVKAYKPDAEIFRIAERKFGINPEETVFYDDSQANVEAARRLGFKGLFVNDPGRSFESYLTDAH